MIYLLSALIGVVAGMRTMTAPTAIAWGAVAGMLAVDGSAIAFMGFTWTPWILTVLAIGELIVDKLPATPSRTVPSAFTARIVSGALCGAAIGVSAESWWIGAIAGVVGAVVGTLGGRAARGGLAKKFGNDRPGAIVEDVVAVAGAALIVVGAP